MLWFMATHSKQSLSGLRVLDISRVLAGPWAAQVLADHGAIVTKVESPSGDDTRQYGPPFIEDTAPYFLGLNRNKKGIALDLSKQEGVELLRTLIDRSDVVIENYKLSSWKKWGIGDFSELRRTNKRLIHCRLTGYGDTGPMASLPGYDAAVQAMSGLMAINGDENSGPLRIGVPIVDISAGNNLAIGALLALNERAQSGLGQLVEINLLSTAMNILHPHAINAMYGSVPQRTGNTHGNIFPYDAFQTKTVPIYLAVGNDRQFRIFCDSVGLATLGEDIRFATNRVRVENKVVLKELITRALCMIDGVQLSDTLMKKGVPCSPIFELSQSLRVEQLHATESLIQRDGYKSVATPIKLSRTPGSFVRKPPLTGEHTVEVLNEYGFHENDINLLVKNNVVKQSKETA
jgi:crotonobetainyl-CoA:carnitine CoA-transferase CaiB-like acyl-CoA transferase